MEVFFNVAVTQNEVNQIFQSMVYYATRSPKAGPLVYGTVVGRLNPGISFLVANVTAATPMSARMSSALQVSHWLNFLEAHGAVIRPPAALGAAARLVMRCKLDGGPDFPFTI